MKSIKGCVREPPTIESATTLLNNLFFDPKRYDLARFGRFKFNEKLNLSERITGHVAAQDVVSPITGEILLEKGQLIEREKALEIMNNGVNVVYLDVDGKTVKVISNKMVEIKEFIHFDISDIGLTPTVRFDVLSDILAKYDKEEDIRRALFENRYNLMPKHITKEDVIASISYIFNLTHGVGETDDIDHLGNRRVRSVGELLQNQFRIGISRMERVVRERMTIQDIDSITPQALINPRPVTAAIKEFFGSSQLSQFMDQPNPLAELTHKRRLSALGPGGLSRERASFEVRDVHYSHYGRMCPIETPEGPNIGLINSLSTFARINEYGFIEAPYRKVDKKNKVVTNEIEYLTAKEEDKYVIAQANAELDENGWFIKNKVASRYKSEKYEVDRDRIDYMDVSPKQLVSVATSLIPFLENDDANRALMGSNMQRQAVPLIKTEAPVIGPNGIQGGGGFRRVHRCQRIGVVESVEAKQIVIRNDKGKRDVYRLLKYKRSNQGTCINQRPIVRAVREWKKARLSPTVLLRTTENWL